MCFARVWQAMRAFKELIADCWDQDGEARLTALCVQERCLEIETFWHRQKGIAAGSLSIVNDVVNVTMRFRFYRFVNFQLLVI